MNFCHFELIGRYRLTISPDLLEFIERTFVATAPAASRAAVRAEALREAEGSELEISGDGTIVSRAHDLELFRTTVAPSVERVDAITFDKPTGPVTLRMSDADTVVAHQPHKPLATFRRTAI